MDDEKKHDPTDALTDATLAGVPTPRTGLRTAYVRRTRRPCFGHPLDPVASLPNSTSLRETANSVLEAQKGNPMERARERDSPLSSCPQQ